MPTFTALLATVPGQVTLEVFASKVGVTQAAMRSELLLNAGLRAYFVKMVAHAMGEVPA